MTAAIPNQADAVFADDGGWTYLPDIITTDEASSLAATCLARLAELADDVRNGDKPWSGTRRLVELSDRLPEEMARILQHRDVVGAVKRILGEAVTVGETTFRCPFPGFGEQKLHADDLALTDVTTTRGLTAVVPLVDFTIDNGATRLLPGSHRRVDLQRLSGNLDDHPDEIVLTGRAGGMFLFSRHVLHSGTRNNSAEPRPALQITWEPTRS